MSGAGAPDRDPGPAVALPGRGCGLGDVEVVFLDLDGCLVDSRDAIATCLNLGLGAVGVGPRPAAELHQLIGPPLLESYQALLHAAGHDPDDADRCITAYREAYRDVSLTHTTVVTGVPEMLAALGRDRTLAVVTSKPVAFATPIVEQLGLAPALAAVHGPALDELREPKAVTLARALAAVAPHVPRAGTAMVGDRHHDVDAGRACGTRTVGVTWGIGDAEELAHADVVVDAPPELVTCLRPPRPGS
jgi:phosphoglycolate phosphatase